MTPGKIIHGGDPCRKQLKEEAETKYGLWLYLNPGTYVLTTGTVKLQDPAVVLLRSDLFNPCMWLSKKKNKSAVF